MKLMTILISSQTETLLQEQAGRLGQDADSLADTLLREVLEMEAREFEETCTTIVEGLADIEADRTVSFEDARTAWEAEKAARLQKVPAAA